MSSIPSTTASLYGGSLPPKPSHSLTVHEHSSKALRASRLDSFINESPSEGNRLAALASKPSTTVSTAVAGGLPKETTNTVETNTQTSENGDHVNKMIDKKQTT